MFSDSVVLPGKVAAQIITTLTEDNERLTNNLNAVQEYRGLEVEMLSKSMKAMEEVREIHHWYRQLDGTECCANCGPGYPCKTIKALNQGEEEAPNVDL